MTFVFATQTYEFDMRYLGFVPLVQCKDDTVAAQAVEVLFLKLESIHVSREMIVSLAAIAELVEFVHPRPSCSPTPLHQPAVPLISCSNAPLIRPSK